jgi:hypothetical protein
MKFTPFLGAGILSAGILSASLYAAECDFEPPARGSSSADASFGYPAAAIYLFKDSYLDISKMDQRDPAVKNVSGTDTAWVYRSELDSTFFVIVAEKFVKVARVAYSSNQDDFVDSLFSVHHDAIFKDEFPRLQKAGVFKGTAEQADSLVNHVFELCRTYYFKELGYTGCIYNSPNQRGSRNNDNDFDGVDIPLAIFSVAGEFFSILDTLNFCPDYKYPATDSISVPDSIIAPPQNLAQTRTSVGFVRLGLNRYQIAGAKPNAPYKAFSLNGQLLERGILHDGVFTAKKLPVILILNDGRSLYLKD